jgi:hypothetical protein
MKTKNINTTISSEPIAQPVEQTLRDPNTGELVTELKTDEVSQVPQAPNRDVSDKETSHAE